jgi:hypothetical protein
LDKVADVERDLKCLRCETAMIEGQVIDARYYLSGLWVDGIPEMGWLSPKVKAADTTKIRSFRCPKCGYVEANAMP